MFDLDSYDSERRPSSLEVKVSMSTSVSALNKSRLPGLDYALNPYRGCQHGCAYCYSPHLLNIPLSQWGKQVEVRGNLPSLIVKELRKRSGIIGLGTMTDPYQPVEANARITRKCLEVIMRSSSRISLHTKSDLVLRDIDILEKMKGAEVGVTITTHQDAQASIFEPVAPPPSRRLEAIRSLIDRGIDTYVLVGPAIPMITDADAPGLASAIIGTGVGKVMVDRLRLRPGMLEHMISHIGGRLDERRFALLANSSSYLSEMEERMCTLFEDAGLKVVKAF
jgi:DNA repair photolyase